MLSRDDTHPGLTEVEQARTSAHVSSDLHGLGVVVVLFLLALFGVACGSEGGESTPARKHTGSASASAEQSAASPQQEAPPPVEPSGDAARGKELVTEMQCQRCHGGLDEVEPIASTSHCFQCHQDVMDGKYRHKPDNARWQQNVKHLTAVPSLAAIGERYDYGWVVRYLLDPHDLRPNLVPTMPRLPLDRQQARDIATFLTEGGREREDTSLQGADLARGRKLIEQKGCGSCHMFGGVPALPDAPKAHAPDERRYETRPAVQLAPDLRWTRERVDAATLMAWLHDPAAIKPGTLMPQTPMTAQERRDIAAYILGAELEPAPAHAIPELPKPLDRPVRFAEVAEKLFDVTCRHCHQDPNDAMGDGGPGNTGGFGFPPRGLQLTSYERVLAGYKDDDGERHSVFTKMADGTPRLVAALMARHAEEAGAPNPEIRGMPLGLPPVAVDDIQLLVSWIAQGRPR